MQGCFGVKHGLSQVPQPHASAGDFAGVGGFVDSLRLVGGQSLCDGWLEETITSPAWRRVPVEQWNSWDFYMVCSVLGCGVPMDVYISLDPGIFAGSSSMDILDMGSAVTSSGEKMDEEIDDVSGTDLVPTSSHEKMGEELENMDDVSGMDIAPTSSHEKMGEKLQNVDDVSGMGPAPTSSTEGMVIVCSGGCPEKGWRWRCPRPGTPTRCFGARRQPAGEAGGELWALRRARGGLFQWHVERRLPGRLGSAGRRRCLPGAGLWHGAAGTELGALRSRHGAAVAVHP